MHPNIGACVQIVHPALNSLVQGEVWDRWLHELGRVVYPDAEVQLFNQSYAIWAEAKQRASEDRQQQRNLWAAQQEAGIGSVR